MYARRAASYYCKVQCGVDISTSAVARAEHEAVSSGLPLRSAHATTHKTRSWPVGMLGLYALLLHENRTYSFLLVLHSPWQIRRENTPARRTTPLWQRIHEWYTMRMRNQNTLELRCVCVSVPGACIHISHLRCCTSDPGARLVDLPDVEMLILLQALLKLIGSKTLCQDALTSFIKPGR